MSETTDGRILVDKLEHHILKITIDRPPVNAMNIDMFGKFYDTLRSIATDDDIRCVVLCSPSMKMFGAGSDVKQYPNLLDDPLQKKLFRENQVLNMLEYLPQVSIAAVEGTACGGGLELAVACDLRVMSETARVSYPEINLGLFPSSGGIFRTAKLIGPNKTLEMALSGEFISAQECYRIGLANRLCAPGTVLEEALKWAEKIASRPIPSVRVIKKSVRETWNKSSEDSFYRSMIYAEELFRSPEGTEGIHSFIEKRPPNFE